MSDLPKISYSDGGVHVTVDLRALDQRMREAQQWLGDRVLEDCKACMPHLTGDLQQRSRTENDGKQVRFPGPYARYLYGGKVKWRFRCPMCGHVASVQDFKDAGAKSPSCAYQECLGRYTGKGTPKKGDSSGCNWAAYGLFGIPAEHDIVIVAPGDQVDVYPFADGEQEADNG